MLFSVGTALMVGAGVVLAQSGTVTVGTVLLLFQYSQMVRRPIEQILGQVKQLQQAGASSIRVADLLAMRPTIVDVASPRVLPEVGPLRVLFDGVTFAYADDPPVLHDVTLTVEAGRSLGLVGRTGSGKTTITRLLVRFYESQAGRVEVGGVDVRDAPLGQLRRRVRLITQDVQLFDASVRDNLTLFDENVPNDAVAAALAAVGLDEWLAGLPEGLAATIGPGGIGVSAGEAQLLALARAFVADPGLVILDEPSSRLDPVTEARIATAIDRLLAGRTAIVIAHRPATLARVDDVAVLADGKIVQHGARRDLVHDPRSSFHQLLDGSS
jgi:ABC-type multidrug transport system fused ATPase/permease subunit